MIAVFSHEMKSYFRSLPAYVFGAFLLIFTVIGALMYNINAAVSNFEYVLEFCSIVFRQSSLAVLQHYAELGYSEDENNYPVAAMRHVLIMADYAAERCSDYASIGKL